MSKSGEADARARDDSRIITFLGVITVLLIGGIILLDATGATAETTQPLVGLAGGALGALITRATGSTQRNSASASSDENEMAIIGRAATKSIIAEAMRQMGVSGTAGGKPE